MLSSIENTTADHCVTNDKVIVQIESARSSSSSPSINMFYCTVHSLATMAKAVDIALRYFDTDHPPAIASRMFRYHSSSRTLSVIHGQFCHKNGCDVPAELPTFLCSLNLTDMVEFNIDQ